MVNIFKNTSLIASCTALHNDFKAAFMTVPEHLSCCCQHPVTVDIIGKIAKPYFYPGSYNANAAHDKRTCHHGLHAKHMLNARPYLCPTPVSLLLTRGQFAILTALALHLCAKKNY